MFIKPYFKHNKTTGERYTVFKLCESYRLNGGIHHHIIISFDNSNLLQEANINFRHRAVQDIQEGAWMHRDF